MSINLAFALIIVATAATGLLAGASLDQSIKQLPTRHRIGVVTYSIYSRASDLGNGILWYALLGIGAALFTIGAAIVVYFSGAGQTQTIPIYLGAVLAVLHSLATTEAAPTNFSQRGVADDEAALTAVFNKFEKWQTLRCMLQVVNFGVMLWALVAYSKFS